MHPEKFELNVALVLCVLYIKNGWDIYTSVLQEVMN